MITTLDDITKLYDELCPVHYYATHDALERGKILTWQGDDFYPPTLYLHPDDLDELRDQLPEYRFVHIREWKPSQADLLRSIDAAIARMKGHRPHAYAPPEKE
jgi:hypothetical protein